MPTVAILRNVLIQFYYNDHDPPHFHARGRGFSARVGIEDAAFLDIQGVMPVSIQRDIVEWTGRRHAELAENWRLARLNQPLNRIDP